MHPQNPEPVTDLFMVSVTTTPYRKHLLRRLRSQLGCEVHEIQLGADATKLRELDGSFKKSINWRPRRWAMHLFQAITAWRAIRQTPWPAVIVNGYYDPALVLIMLRCARNGVPVFLRADSNISDERGKSRSRLRAKRQLRALVHRLVDGVMPVGTQGSRYFAHYGFSENEIHVVPYEIDQTFFRTSPSDDEEARIEAIVGTLQSRRFMIFSGRLEPVKRVDLLLDAFGDVANRLPDWDLLIAGSGSLEEPLGSSLRPDLIHRIHWLGWCTQADLRAAYGMAEVFVLPSEREPWAVVVNEAIASGLIVVASDAVGAAHDLVEDGQTGLIFAKGSRQDLATALIRATEMCENPGIHEKSWDRYADFRDKFDASAGIRSALNSTINHQTRHDE